MGRDADGRVPLEAVAQVGDLLRHLVLRVGHDLAGLSGAHVVAVDAAAVAPGVDDVRVPRVDGHVAALAATHLVLLLEVGDDGGRQPAGHRHRGVVLLRAVQPVRELLVHGHAVELRGRLVALAGPAAPTVERDRRPAVVALDHDVRVVGVDPQLVAVTVGDGGDGDERAPAVHGPVQQHVVDPDGVLVLRVGGHAHVVPRTVEELLLVGEPPPGVAAVVGAVHAALLVARLDDRPHAVGVGRGDRDAGLPEQAVREPGGELLPGVAAVLAAVDAALRRAGDHAPREALRTPRRGVEDARIRGVDGDVDDARGVAHVQDLLPAPAPVLRAEDASLLVSAEQAAQRRHVDEIRVPRVYLDLPDLAGRAQPDVGPRLPLVGGAVHPDPGGDVAPRLRRPGADVDHVGVGGRHGDGAHRPRVELPVGDVAPGDAGVVALPDAPARAPHVEEEGLAGHACHRGDAAAPVRPHVPVGERRQEGGVDRAGGGLGGQRVRADRHGEEGDEERVSPAAGGRAEAGEAREDDPGRRVHGSRSERVRRGNGRHNTNPAHLRPRSGAEDAMTAP